MPFQRIIELVPNGTLTLGVEGVIWLQQLRGANSFKFNHDEYTYKYTYEDRQHFSFFYEAIRDGVTRREQVPLELFEFSGEHDLIIDIGAHFGLYTVIFGVQNPTATVVAYEPHAYNAKTCQMQVRQNGLNADVHQAAVGDTDGTTELVLSSSTAAGLNWYESSIGHSISHSPLNADTETVDVVSLDTIFDEYEADAPFVKIDAEGAEYQIMQTLLNRQEDISGFVELHPDRIDDGSAFDIICWIEEHGKEYDIVKEALSS